MFHPSIHPEKYFKLITLIVLVGITAGYIVSELVLVIAHFLWMAFTAVLSAHQFVEEERKHHTNFIELLLFNPEIRFFIFEFIAVAGIVSVLYVNSREIGSIVLIVWWFFSYKFYSHYINLKKKKKS